MTGPQIRVKVQRRPQIKLKLLPKFPADVTVSSPLELVRAGGNYAFSLDINELIDSTTPTYDQRYQRIWVYDSLAAAAAATIPDEVDIVETLGHSTAGDNGGARYYRIAASTAAAWRFLDARGQWWSLLNRAVTPEMFGAFSGSDCTAAFQSVATWINLVGAGLGGATVNGKHGAEYKIWPAATGPATLFLLSGVRGVTLDLGSCEFTTDNLFTTGSVTPRFMAFRGGSVVVNGLNFEQTALTTLESAKGTVLFEIADNSGGPYSSNFILNNIVQIGGTQGIAVGPAQPHVLRGAARIEVNNAEFDTVFYPQLFQGAGEQYTARGVSTKNAGRSYFAEGVGQHDVEMLSEGSASGNADCVIISYGRPQYDEERNANTSIRLRYRNVGRAADTISEACVVLHMRQTIAALTVTNAVNNGSGKVRLTVNTAADVASDNVLFFSSIGGTTEANGKHRITKINATTIDLPDVTFVNAYTSGGRARVPATLKNIDLDFDVSSADGYQQPPLVLTYRSNSDLSPDDSGVPCGYTFENVTISGTAKDYNNGTKVLDLFSNDYAISSTGHSYGIWTGEEKIRNIFVRDLTIDGTSSSVKIVATDVASNLVVENVVSPASTVAWTVTDPSRKVRYINAVANGLTAVQDGAAVFQNGTKVEIGSSGVIGPLVQWGDTAGTNKVTVSPPTGAIGNIALTWPGTTGTVLNTNNNVTVTQKVMSGASNTFTNIPLGTAVTGTLAATLGGTGQASYAVGDILYASTSTVLSKLADVATGNALISGGVGVAPAYGKIGLATHVSGTLPIANGGTGATTGAVVSVKKQVFTASGTYTPSTGMLYCVVELVGGGGGGGAVNSSSSTTVLMGGGGGAGGYSRSVITAATIGASQVVTIGAAGAGGAAGSNNGVAGGDTSLGALVIGKGGAGGTFALTASTGGLGGAGGVAGTGDFAPGGTPGLSGCYSTVGQYYSTPMGGASVFGGPGTCSLTVTGGGITGTAATGHGSGGGGGGVGQTTTTVAGGNGKAGAIFITEFCSQ